MSAILAICSALMLFVLELIRRNRPKAHDKPVFLPRYIHPGHTWLRLNEDGEAVVGLDDFAQRIIGSPTEVKMPKLLRKVRQGEPVIQITNGGRTVSLVSPVTGRVIEKNEMVQRDPSLINLSPYQDGWLFKVHPGKVRAEVSNLFTGRWAWAWQETVNAQLQRFFSTTPALMLQDGGLVIPHLAERCSDEEWNALVQEFFLMRDNKEHPYERKEELS